MSSEHTPGPLSYGRIKKLNKPHSHSSHNLSNFPSTIPPNPDQYPQPSSQKNLIPFNSQNQPLEQITKNSVHYQTPQNMRNRDHQPETDFLTGFDKCIPQPFTQNLPNYHQETQEQSSRNSSKRHSPYARGPVPQYQKYVPGPPFSAFHLWFPEYREAEQRAEYYHKQSQELIKTYGTDDIIMPFYVPNPDEEIPVEGDNEVAEPPQFKFGTESSQYDQIPEGLRYYLQKRQSSLRNPQVFTLQQIKKKIQSINITRKFKSDGNNQNQNKNDQNTSQTRPQKIQSTLTQKPFSDIGKEMQQIILEKRNELKAKAQKIINRRKQAIIEESQPVSSQYQTPNNKVKHRVNHDALNEEKQRNRPMIELNRTTDERFIFQMGFQDLEKTVEKNLKTMDDALKMGPFGELMGERRFHAKVDYLKKQVQILYNRPERKISRNKSFKKIIPELKLNKSFKEDDREFMLNVSGRGSKKVFENSVKSKRDSIADSEYQKMVKMENNQKQSVKIDLSSENSSIRNMNEETFKQVYSSEIIVNETKEQPDTEVKISGEQNHPGTILGPSLIVVEESQEPIIQKNLNSIPQQSEEKLTERSSSETDGFKKMMEENSNQVSMIYPMDRNQQVHQIELENESLILKSTDQENLCTLSQKKSFFRVYQQQLDDSTKSPNGKLQIFKEKKAEGEQSQLYQPMEVESNGSFENNDNEIQIFKKYNNMVESPNLLRSVQTNLHEEEDDPNFHSVPCRNYMLDSSESEEPSTHRLGPLLKGNVEETNNAADLEIEASMTEHEDHE